MKAEHAEQIIALLTEIRDELQLPRLSRVARELLQQENAAKDAAARREATAAAAAAARRASPPAPMLWAGGAGILTVRERERLPSDDDSGKTGSGP